MKKGWISIAIAFVLLGFIFYTNQANTGARDTKPEVGFMAPDFTLTNEAGEEVNLNQLKGKPVFINFWASWCPPCKQEMPYIQEAYEKYSDQVVFLGVNITISDIKEDAIAFMKSNQYEMPILFDYKGDVTDLYRSNTIPTSYFINKDGMIKAKHIGAMTFDQIESYLDKAMED